MVAAPPKASQPQNIIESEPSTTCTLCPRLVDFRLKNNSDNPGWFNAPVPSFGPKNAELLIVGLAPGLKGANKTGRPFTGDYAGDLLYETLLRFGFAKGLYQARADDGLRLVNCMISNAVRCVPPQNKPIGTEIATCRQFLRARIANLKRLKVIVVLGRIAHDSTLTALGAKKSMHPFGHNKTHLISYNDAKRGKPPRDLVVIDSYHCSRYNTNTGRLTPDMFNAVFENAKARI